jgi:ABC-type glycerol-3-phosphate transport system permease component
MQTSLKKSTRRKSSARQQRKAVFIYIVLLVLAIIFIAPFAWLIITSLKTTSELSAFPVEFLPAVPQWGNFVQAFTQINYLAYTGNSLIVSITYSVLVAFSSAFVGFGFARLRGRGKKQLFMLMLSTMMLPQIVTAIPTYILFSHIGLIDTYWPWVFWGLGSSPFLVFLFRQFFSAIPVDLDEAAILDGCSYFRIFWRIYLPLSMPVVATALVLSFTTTWGDFFTQQLFLNQDNATLAVAIASGYLDPHGNPLTVLQAAGSIFYILPILVVFFFAQKAFVRGIVTSGIKG